MQNALILLLSTAGTPELQQSHKSRLLYDHPTLYNNFKALSFDNTYINYHSFGTI